MTECRDKERAEAGARLRMFRRALGYKTAASFARVLGYSPGRYCRYERVFFQNGGPLALFVHALKNAGLDWIDLNWLLFGKPSNTPGPSTAKEREVLAVLRAMPDWAKPPFMRFGLRLANGMLMAKAQHLFWQEVALEQAKEAGRAVLWPQ